MMVPVKRCPFQRMLIVQLVCYYLASCMNEAKAEQISWNTCTYIVTPNGTCLDSSHIPCYTLDTYVQNASMYFVSNTTFCFLSGRHIINVTLAIKSVSNIALIGFGITIQSSVHDKATQFNFSEIPQDKNITFLESTAIIECKNLSGFLYNDIDYLLLANLTIMNCGANMTGILPYLQKTSSVGISRVHYVAVFMINISNLHIEATSIQNSTGYGLVGVNIFGQSQIIGSSFVGNNQFVKRYLQQYNAIITYCDDGSSYTTPTFYVNYARIDEYAGGNAIFIYDALANYSVEPTLDISFCLFALGIDGSIGLVATKELRYPNVYFNSMGTGLGVKLLQTSYKVFITITNTMTYRNQASFGGNLNFQVNPLTFDIILTNVCSDKGISEIGGTLSFFILNSTYSALNKNLDQLRVTNSTFSSNYKAPNAFYIYMLEWSFPMQFEKCSFFVNCALLSLGLPSSTNQIIFNNTIFSAAGCNSGIGAFNVTSVEVLNCSFTNYANIYGSHSSIYIADSKFFNIGMSALQLDNSYLSLTGNISFINNTVKGDGGALYLSYSLLTLIAPVNISFTNNNASLRGGAIFIRKYIVDGKCNIIFNDLNGTLQNPGVHLFFDGNYANDVGDVLYGGDIDLCTYDCSLTPNYCSSSGGSMLTIFNAITLCGNKTCDNSASNLARISSDPRVICSCTNSTIDCSSKTGIEHPVVYPGQIIDIPIVTVGQLNGISPDSVLSYTCDVSDDQSNINCTSPTFSEDQQRTMQHCSNYHYHLKGKDNQHYRSAIILLSKTAYSGGDFTSTYSIFVTIFPCPTAIGFVWNQMTKMCSCSPVLQKYNVQCDINTLTVLKTGTLWIGNSSSGVLAVHAHCPHDYCKSDDTFTLENQDEQCNYNHSGVLCGGCNRNFSAVFGSSHCKLCTDHDVWILVPIAVLGAVMVALLFLLNCTVTKGTINSIILYANIVGPSILHVLPHTNHGGGFKTFLVVFIDWLNFDLGIELCFYNGMDEYVKIWLELLFPLYILVLVGAIITGSRWSSKLAWLSKRNAVPVLATLILLTYTNVLQTVIEIFSYSQLDTGNYTDQNPLVWLPDGNILYASGKHIYLLIAGSIVTISFIVPYTMILLLSPWLQSRSQMRLLNWVNRLKPFIDANQAPFKDQYRYWPGVHLMLRLVLYSVFTTNQANDINVNILANAIVGCFYCGMTNIFSVYKNWLLSIIETFFVINLLCLSILMLYIHNSTDPANDTLIIACTGSAFIVFIAIVAFHFYEFLKDLFNALKLTRETTNQTVQPYQQEATEESLLLTSTRMTRDPIIFDSHIHTRV